MSFLSRTAKAGVRVAIVAGAVKISLDNDVWSLRTNSGSETYEKMKRYVLPGTIVYKDNLPSANEFQVNVRSRWNRNVNCAFSYISKFPSIVRNKLGEATSSFNSKQ